MTFSVVILAAGQGQRMRSSLPKVLEPIGGLSLLERIINTVKKLNPHSILVIYGHQGERIKKALSNVNGITWVPQLEQKGTGHATLQALPYLKGIDKALILNGDVPLISEATLNSFLGSNTTPEVKLITALVENPNGLGRIVRDSFGKFLRIVEEKDATSAEKNIREINTGIWSMLTSDLEAWLPKLSTQNAQSEYYLTDIIPLAHQEQRLISTFSPSSTWEVLGVNDHSELAVLERHFQEDQAQTLMKAGVRMMDPKRFDARGTIQAGFDVVIDVNVILTGNVTLGDRVSIGPNVMIKDSIIQEDVQILANSVIEGSVVGKGSVIGPFARLRPDTELDHNVKIGNFVEIKKAKIGKRSKINHLSYIGDAKLGQDVNVGAGTITCNYDGKNKHLTVIGDEVFIGSDTQLIAPVTVGEKTTIGAGTTVVKDVPANSLIHNRIEHRMKTPWVKDPKERSGDDKHEEGKE